MNRHLMSVTTALCAAFVAAFGAVPLRADETPQERLQTATEVFSEIMATPDKAIPQDLLEKSHCIVIVPGLKKGAFIVGGKFGEDLYLAARATATAGRLPVRCAWKAAAWVSKSAAPKPMLSCWS